MGQRHLMICIALNAEAIYFHMSFGTRSTRYPSLRSNYGKRSNDASRQRGADYRVKRWRLWYETLRVGLGEVVR